jgi:hypothetical protein
MHKLVALAALMLAACGGGGGTKSATTTTQETHVITGTFVLQGLPKDDPLDENDLGIDDGNFYVNNGSCEGADGYDDVQSGLQVTVSNEAGTVIGTGSLDTSEVTDEGCRFNFRVDNVPVAKFYKIAVGRRGELSYSYEDMKANSWSVSLTLG